MLNITVQDCFFSLSMQKMEKDEDNERKTNQGQTEIH